MILATTPLAPVFDFPLRPAVLEPQKGLSHKNKYSTKFDKELSVVMKEMKMDLPALRIVLNTNIGEMFIRDNYLPTRCVAQWRVLTRIWYGPEDAHRRKLRRLIFSKEYDIVAMVLMLLVKFPHRTVCGIIESFQMI